MLAPTGFYADYGCHVRIRGQANALQARGHEVCIVTYPGGRDVDGLRTLRPPGWRRGREMLTGSAWWKLILDAMLAPLAWQVAHRYRPDLIHAYLHEGALLGTFLSRLYHLPLVFDFQGSLVSEMLDRRFLSRRSPFVGSLRRLERWLAHQPDAILPSSHHAVGLLASAFGVRRERLHVLLDSVDDEAFRPREMHDAARLSALRQRLRLPAGRPLVVYLGLLAPYQGTDTLLRAIARLKVRRGTMPVPFFLVMGFPHVPHYRSMAQALGIAEDVRFTGAVAYDEAPAYLALGDVAVAPKQSETEGSGKLLPYMATGLPIVAADIPAHRQYLEEEGLYFPAGDTEALAEALRRSLAEDHAWRRRVGECLRGRVSARYLWSHAATQVEAVYHEVCSA